MAQSSRTSAGRTHRAEAGSVLLLVLLVTLLILGVGLTAMWVSTSGSKISGNLIRRQEALYAAETGLEHAEAILRGPIGWSALLHGSDGSLCTPSSTAYVPGKGMILCQGNTPLENYYFMSASQASATDTLANQLANNVRYTVYVRNDDFEYQWCNATAEPGETSLADVGDCDGDGSGNSNTDRDMRRYDDQDRRVVVRVEGIGRDGVSQVAIEATVGAAMTAASRGSYTQRGGSGGQGSNAVAAGSLPPPATP